MEHVLDTETATPLQYCEIIDRSQPDMLSQSIFDLRDTLFDMGRDRTRLEMEDIMRNYHGLRVVDCAYIADMGRNSSNGFSVSVKNGSEETFYPPIYCEFAEIWEGKLRTLDRTRVVALEGTIGADAWYLEIRLEDCRILKVE